VRKVVTSKGVHERGVDSLGLEDVQQLAKVGRLLVLGAHVLALQARGADEVGEARCGRR